MTGPETRVGPFDVCGPLPSAGVTMLEASAGTGKTYTIAALATRYVADGIPLERMLLVTFTRMATGELRSRVRRRLVEARRGLAGVLDGHAVDPADEVLALLASGTAAEVELRHHRLSVALAGFDAATITTTHGFCHQMLAGLGVAGDIETTTAVVEDVSDLVEEVVDDRYLARALQTATPPFGRVEALDVSLAAVANPRTPIAVVGGNPETPGRLRRRLALSVRADVARRKRDAGLLTYDDLLTRLSDALADPVSGPDACRRLRDRYDVVAVDEFQDTDELQWKILRAAFGENTTLVLIGDPKQAIYAFRGADVHAYLDAAGRADRTGTLGINWRSDQELLDAYDALWDGASLGPADIVYRRVEAAPAHRVAGLETSGDGAPLRVRVVARTDGDVLLTPKGFANKVSAKAAIGRDLAAQVVGLLREPAWLIERDDRGEETKRCRLTPGDIAVLTRSHRNAAMWSDALRAAGVPAVINGVGSVFATPAAREWLLLLEAVERPASSPRIHNVALTSFVGWTAAEVVAADDVAWEALHASCHHWGAVLRRAGVATLLELVSRTGRLPGRELARADGERRLTDVRHLGQLLHAEATAERLGTTALTAWLRRRIRDAADDSGVEERSRRLESDADAVQVLTIHRSKGLEFPVVAYPDLWEPQWIPEDTEPVIYHDDSGVRTLDVAGRGADFVDHRHRQRVELRGEDLRLAYVALTRARNRSLLWWVGSNDAGDSPIGRMLFGRRPDGTVPADGVRTPGDEVAFERFARLESAAPGSVRVERVAAAAVSRWSPPPVEAVQLRAATWGRSIDDRWRRTSYSGLTSDAHDPVVTSEPEQVTLDDEAVAAGDVGFQTDGSQTGGVDADNVQANGGDGSTGSGVVEVARREKALRSARVPLADMPGGARVGSVVHAVLEEVDFADDDLAGAVGAALGRVQARGTVPIGPPAVVVAGLVAALRTPLGSLADERPLATLGRADRLDELSFELPVAGGDRPVGAVDLGDVADLVERHLPAGDPLEGYPARLRDPSVAGAWRGFLTGSLDLVARLTDAGGRPRWIVADYKTNVLGEDRSTLSAWDYRPEALATAMQAAHYPLQALLYLVALHRYLRWRVAGYDPGQHLGGALYLFVRGMTGPDVARIGGVPGGVFAWRPPAALVVGLSDLLDHGAVPAAGAVAP